MKITIKEFAQEIILSNEELDNDNYIDLIIPKDSNEYAEVTIPLEELFQAISAFRKIKKDRLDNITSSGNTIYKYGKK